MSRSYRLRDLLDRGAILAATDLFIVGRYGEQALGLYMTADGGRTYVAVRDFDLGEEALSWSILEWEDAAMDRLAGYVEESERMAG